MPQEGAHANLVRCLGERHVSVSTFSCLPVSLLLYNGLPTHCYIPTSLLICLNLRFELSLYLVQAISTSVSIYLDLSLGSPRFFHNRLILAVSFIRLLVPKRSNMF